MERATTTYIVLKELAGNPPTELNALQSVLAPHADFLTHVWIFLWIVTAFVLIGIYIRALRNTHS